MFSIDDIVITSPQDTDGYTLNQLISNSPPLDTNSVYCNLLQCSYFADTSIAAHHDGELVGFISGFLNPKSTDTLFVWQVVVATKARGIGLARRMLHELLQQPVCQQVSYLETTINPDNQASWKLFERLQQDLECNANRTIRFDSQAHFNGQHEDECLYRIGPFTTNQVKL